MKKFTLLGKNCVTAVTNSTSVKRALIRQHPRPSLSDNRKHAQGKNISEKVIYILNEDAQIHNSLSTSIFP